MGYFQRASALHFRINCAVSDIISTDCNSEKKTATICESLQHVLQSLNPKQILHALCNRSKHNITDICDSQIVGFSILHKLQSQFKYYFHITRTQGQEPLVKKPGNNPLALVKFQRRGNPLSAGLFWNQRKGDYPLV